MWGKVKRNVGSVKKREKCERVYGVSVGVWGKVKTEVRKFRGVCWGLGLDKDRYEEVWEKL